MYSEICASCNEFVIINVIVILFYTQITRLAVCSIDKVLDVAQGIVVHVSGDCFVLRNSSLFKCETVSREREEGGHGDKRVDE